MNEIDLIVELNKALVTADYKSRVVGISRNGVFVTYEGGESEDVILPFVTTTAQNLLAERNENLD